MKLVPFCALFLILFIGSDLELGVGIVVVDIYKTAEIHFYKAKGDKTPDRSIKLVNTKSEIFVEPSSHKEWLAPENLWLDYSILNFCYTRQEGEWVEVVVNEKSGLRRWIRVNEHVVAVPWPKFLLDYTTVVEPIESVFVRTAPYAESKAIRKTTSQDCFEAMEIKDDWIRIRTSQGLECSEHPEPITTGWIKWKEGNKLVIRYFLTC